MRSKQSLTFLAAIALLFALFFSQTYARDKKDKSQKDAGQAVVIAQISDSHIGLARAPEAVQNLQRVVDMINQRNVDAVIVTGDIGERPEAWEQAKAVYSKLKAKTFFVPGNHDVSAQRPDSLRNWRSMFGDDFYEAHIKGVTIVALNGQLMGNYDNFNQKKASPLSSDGKHEAERMFSWLKKVSPPVPDQPSEHAARGSEGDERRPDAGDSNRSKLIFAMQHEPIDRASDFPPDDKDYWTIQEPYRSQVIEELHRLGVKHMFVGHWHKGMVFSAHDITFHVAPATSWSPTGDKLGFAVHTITPDGDVKTEFVYIDADPHPAR